MVYESCPMFGGYGVGGFYLNWIIVALIFALVFWGIYYLLIKNKEYSKVSRGGRKK